METLRTEFSNRFVANKRTTKSEEKPSYGTTYAKASVIEEGYGGRCR
ncbi:MAG TPA: hypothetical protein VFI33_14995 [Puia sp.]|nr:hypothetical protein [Puia sp.]